MSRASWEATETFDEAFRVLSVGVAGLLGDLARPVVAVTSSRHGEGRTLACSQLATAFATRGQKVVAVGLDLAQPDLHRRFGGHNTVGVSDHLTGQRKLGECLQYLETPSHPGHGLFLLPAGPPVAEPSELLDDGRAARMLERLAAQADFVVVDTPPVLAGADALTVGRLAGGALIVVDTRRTSADAVRRARDLLERNGTQLLGIVLNQVRDGDPAAWVSDAEDRHRPAPAIP